MQVSNNTNVAKFFHEIFPEYYGFILSRSVYVLTKLRIAELLESGPMNLTDICQHTACDQILQLEKVLLFVQAHGLFHKDQNGHYQNSGASLDLAYHRSGRTIVEVHDQYWLRLLEANDDALDALQEVDTVSKTEVLTMALAFIPSRALYIAAKMNVFEKLLRKEKVPVIKQLEQMGYVTDGTVTEKAAPLLDPRCRAFILHEIPERWEALAYLEEALTVGGVPFERLFGKTLFNHLQTWPELSAIFADAMTCICEYECAALAQEMDPYIQEGMTIVDVGGGRGRYLQAVLERYPSLRAILFDLQENVANHLLDQKTALCCQFVGGDFFKEVPEAALYHFKRVLHDWSDNECVQILANCAKSAKKGSRLVLHELLLPQKEALMLDIYFMTLFKGKQRTLENFKAILEASGWQLESVTKTKSWLAEIVAIKP